MQPAKLLGGGALKVKIAAAAVALLAIGFWLAPPRTATLAPSEERPVPLLEEQVAQREAAQPFRGVQDIAGRIAARGVALYLDQTAVAAANDFVPPRPAVVDAFGVPIGSGFVLTHRRALNGSRRVRVGRAEDGIGAQLAAYDEATGLALLRTDPPMTEATRVATLMPASGSLAVAAARWTDHELILPVFVAVVADDYLRIGGDSGINAVGLPIYDAEGNLFALGIGRGEARPVRAAIDRLLQRAMAGVRARSFGLAFQELTPALQPVFGETGVIVVDVLPDGPAARGDIRPGDVITVVDDVPVADGAAVRRALAASSSTPTILAGRRAGKPITARLTAVDAFDAAALADRTRAEEPAMLAGALLTPDELTALALPSAARILSINGRLPATPALARRDLSRPGPAAMLIEQGMQRYFVMAPDQP